MFTNNSYAVASTATVQATEIGSFADLQASVTPESSVIRTFARISKDLSEIFQGLTPCAERLHTWLLQQAKAGIPHEVHLTDFAAATHHRKRGGYSLPHIRRALDQLIEVNLVELAFRYSGKVFRLIAHDSRSFSSQLTTETSEDVTKKSKISTSNPHSAVPINKENSAISDKTHPHPVLPDPQGEIGTGALNVESMIPEIEEAIGQPLNPHIHKLILQHTTTTIHNAMSALREQQERGTRIRNPLGWLVKALKTGFTSNTAKQAAKKAAGGLQKDDRPPLSSPALPAPIPDEARKIPEDFGAWFALAQPLQVAIGSEFIGGQFMVHTFTEAIPWDEMRMIWPLARLKERTAAPVPLPSPLPQPVIPQHSPEVIDDPDHREMALARLKAKYSWLPTRKGAIAECEVWGFEIGPEGPQEVDF